MPPFSTIGYTWSMKKVAIIGYGRFGELLATLCKNYFDVHIVESDPARQEAAKKSGFQLLAFEDTTSGMKHF